MTEMGITEMLDYDAETGIFRWVKTNSNRVKVGDIAGCINPNGYVYINVGKKYLAHRIAWLFVHGELPRHQIDHINGIPNDNRLRNLRLSTQSQNLANAKTPSHNTSGFKGVSLCKKTHRWRAWIKKDGRGRHLGRFDTKEQAHAAYCDAAESIFGEFMRKK